MVEMRGKVTWTGGMELLEGRIMDMQNSYKYTLHITDQWEPQRGGKEVYLIQIHLKVRTFAEKPVV